MTFFEWLTVGVATGLCTGVVLVISGRRGRGTVELVGAKEEEDVSGHEEPAESLRGQLLESVFQALGDACLIVDADGVIVLANDYIRRLFAVPEVLVGKKLLDVVLDHRLLDVATAAFKEEEEVEASFEVRVQMNGDVRTRYVIVSATLLKLEDGSPEADHVRVIIRDVTPHRETDQIRKDFVANASHELRTPLSIINGYIENLMEGVVDDPESIRRALETMRKHGDRIARIVEDMLTISKFESVGSEESAALRKGIFDCRECVVDVVERLAPVIEEKKAVVEIGIAEGDPHLSGDRFYWDQIFFNLIENALKENTERGLKVKVSMKRSGDGSASIEVRDDGVGIPRAHLPYVFKRFYRVAKHHSQEIKGTGLGLSIVKRAVEAHGGEIDLRSTPGIETVFLITLPPPPGVEPATGEVSVV